jgi:hypothetical protein
MALTQVITEVIADDAITTNKIVAAAVNSTKVNDSIIKTITLTQAEYDALGSYSSSTIYITT